MPTADSEEAGAQRRRLRPPALLVAGSAVAALFFLASQARRLYFFGDDWAFLLSRSLEWPELMEPHNEHWSTLPLISFRIMFHVFGIDHYLAYALLAILLHLACCVLLYLLMRRSEVPAWPAALCIVPVMFLCGNIGENPLWDFQIGFLGSAALGLVALHLVHEDSRSLLVGAWLVTVASLMCSGMALPMVGWLGAYVLVSRGLTRALVSTVPPMLVYLAWMLWFGREAQSQQTSPTPDQVVEFTATGLALVWQEMLRLPGIGGAVLIGLAAFTLLGRLKDAQRRLALSGMMTVVAMYLLLALARAGLGAQVAGASRYTYFGVLLTLPAFALVISRVSELLGERRLHRVVAGALLVVLLVGNGVAQTLAFTDGRTQLTGDLKPRLLATERLIADDEHFLAQQPSLPYNPDITVEALSRPEIRAALPQDPVTPAQLLDASAVLQVAASADGFDLPPATDLELHGVEGTVVTGGCADLRADRGAWVDLPPSAGGSQVQLTTSAESYPSQLLAGKLASVPVVLTTTPQTATYVATTSTRGTLRVNLPTGRVQLCLPGATSIADQ